jgi:hypothetical protein
MQSLKPVESGQDGETMWVINKVSVERVVREKKEPCGAKQDLSKESADRACLAPLTPGNHASCGQRRSAALASSHPPAVSDRLNNFRRTWQPAVARLRLG